MRDHTHRGEGGCPDTTDRRGSGANVGILSRQPRRLLREEGDGLGSRARSHLLRSTYRTQRRLMKHQHRSDGTTLHNSMEEKQQGRRPSYESHGDFTFFPTDERSTEGLFVAHALRVALPIADKLNLLSMITNCIATMLMEHYRVPGSIFIVFNFFGLYMDNYVLPRSIRLHGALHAHRIFVMATTGMMYVVFFVALPLGIWHQGQMSFFLGLQPWPPEQVSVCPPMLCVALSCICAMMASSLQLCLTPLVHRIAIHLCILGFASMIPAYTPLGHLQEVLFTLLGLTFGDLVGRAFQRVMWQSFTTGLAGQKQLQARLNAVDAEQKVMLTRIEQMKAEKQRLAYDLNLVMARHQRSMPRMRQSVSNGTGSSDAELASLLADGNWEQPEHAPLGRLGRSVHESPATVSSDAELAQIDAESDQEQPEHRMLGRDVHESPAPSSGYCSSEQGCGSMKSDASLISTSLRKRLYASFADGAPWESHVLSMSHGST